MENKKLFELRMNLEYLRGRIKVWAQEKHNIDNSGPYKRLAEQQLLTSRKDYAFYKAQYLRVKAAMEETNE